MCKAIDDMMADSKAEGRESALRDSIQNVMENLHVSITKAMDILNISETERYKYL